MKQIYFSVLFSLIATVSWSQYMIKGSVRDDAGELLPGATVRIAERNLGVATDVNGSYSFNVANGTYTVVASFTGYKSKSQVVTVSGSSVTADFVLDESFELSEVVVSTGSRNTQRTITDSPLPIDILSASEIRSTGQTLFDRALQYRVPSFNTVQTPVNDATSLLDPYEIRNMGPSRTLVLINGKRKNLSSLIYIQTSPGRGEGGADISAIPSDAIQRVEILRDGASAQYGSDAIAGVMNIILKDRVQYGTVSLNTSITSEGDGEMIGFSLNNGASFRETGFVNYTIALSHQALANRPGDVDAAGEAGDFGAAIADVQRFLAKKPDAGNINGDPEKTAGRFLVNFGIPVGDGVDFYGNAAYVSKKVHSFANYRTPYWRPASEQADGSIDNPYALIAQQNNEEYLGYVPSFEGDLTDYNGTVGFRKDLNGWRSDISFTTGGNKQLYTVNNSRNRTLGVNSPLSFKPGGYAFRHNVGNLDIAKMLVDNLNFSIGTEFRQETYTIVAGDTASYVGRGADSFPGTRSSFAGDNTRYNFGGYLGLSYDITEDFLIDGTYRAERYSDFGNTSVYKFSSRYKLADDKITVRASYSTGFRAPMLHQLYLQVAQQSFVPGKGIQDKLIVNNNSEQAKVIGVPKLKPEKSTNITFGVGVNPSRNWSLSLDYYNIAVDDRIILGSEIASSDPNNIIYKILEANNAYAISFFTNGINTRTSGIDLVASYRNLMLGSGKMNFNLAGNYTINNNLDGAKSVSDYEKGDVTKPNGDVINPPVITNSGNSVFDYIQDALLLTSRPKYKAILGIDYGDEKMERQPEQYIVRPYHLPPKRLGRESENSFQTQNCHRPRRQH